MGRGKFHPKSQNELKDNTKNINPGLFDKHTSPPGDGEEGDKTSEYLDALSSACGYGKWK